MSAMMFSYKQSPIIANLDTSSILKSTIFLQYPMIVNQIVGILGLCDYMVHLYLFKPQRMNFFCDIILYRIYGQTLWQSHQWETLNVFYIPTNQHIFLTKLKSVIELKLQLWSVGHLSLHVSSIGTNSSTMTLRWAHIYAPTTKQKFHVYTSEFHNDPHAPRYKKYH